MIKKSNKKGKNNLTKNDKKQLSLLANDWIKIQEMELIQNVKKNNKSLLNTKKSLKQRIGKVEKIIKNQTKKNRRLK
jgi:hypothetical protein